MKTCETCKHFKRNPGWCELLSVSHFRGFKPRRKSFDVHLYGTNQYNNIDAIKIVTSPDFGCTEHEEKEK